MNFEKFKAKTDLFLEKGQMDDQGLSIMVAMERCSAVKDLLGESYESILGENERDYIDRNIKKGMSRLLMDAFKHATEDPDGFMQMMDKLMSDSDSEGGDN